MNAFESKARLALLHRRRAIAQGLAQNQREARALRAPIPGERYPQREEVAQTLGQVAERERSELADIERALEKLDAGGFGVCEVCGGSIGRQRLMAVPEARVCLACSAQEAFAR